MPDEPTMSTPLSITETPRRSNAAPLPSRDEVPPMKVGSLFAGIGGFDLGLERAGMQTAWHVEIDPFCQHILSKHWPDVPCYPDIREVHGHEVEPVDVLCGGFPCQDISLAGEGAGIEGARSSLWKEFARLVDELRPRYVIVENVAALRRRGLDVVLGDLSTLGYDAEWDCIRASDVGAPHRRDRLWIVAYPDGSGREPRERDVHAGESHLAGCSTELADAGDGRPRVFGPPGWLELADGRSPWPVEPDVGRVAHGVPARVDRLRSLGNALVPQIAEHIGHQLLRLAGDADHAGA